jgi:hypothetical protein
VIGYRCFAWNERATLNDPDGPLWCPRAYQGDGRHDNPDLYGCLYVSERDLSPVVEQLARFRGNVLAPPLLRRRGLPLALADLELPDTAELIDLDNPRTLVREALRPSGVATRTQSTTQQQARTLYERHPRAAGLRWWSVHESTWLNATLFDRRGARLRLRAVRTLAMNDPLVIEAAEWLGLPRAR